MPRKIKVVDVVPDNSTEIAIDDTVQPLQIDTDQPVEPIKEDIETVDIKEEQQIAILPTTKVRTNEVHACSKCRKFMTLKTLEHTHANAWNVDRIPEPPPEPEKPTPKTKGRPKKEIVVNKLPRIQEEKEVEEKKEVQVFAPEPRQSFETIRNERLRERVQQRTQRISNLFLQAFWIKLVFL